jgi:hypothetical protein
VLLVLAAAGQESMRQALAALAEPTRRRRRHLDAVRRDTPEWAVVIDRSAHRVQRPQGATAAGTRAADDYCSGETQQHTLTTQVAVDEATGRAVDLPESVPGPTSAITPRERPDLLRRLPPAVGGRGDQASGGGDKRVPGGRVATPRRPPRGRPRPPADGASTTACARRRAGVEPRIGRRRRFEPRAQLDRHHRPAPPSRGRAAAGLVNRQVRRRYPC